MTCSERRVHIKFLKSCHYFGMVLQFKGRFPYPILAKIYFGQMCVGFYECSAVLLFPAKFARERHEAEVAQDFGAVVFARFGKTHHFLIVALFAYWNYHDAAI